VIVDWQFVFALCFFLVILSAIVMPWFILYQLWRVEDRITALEYALGKGYDGGPEPDGGEDHPKAPENIVLFRPAA
jgi:hypothetical protein